MKLNLNWRKVTSKQEITIFDKCYEIISRTREWVPNPSLECRKVSQDMSAKLSSPGGVYLAKKVNKNVCSEDF